MVDAQDTLDTHRVLDRRRRVGEAGDAAGGSDATLSDPSALDDEQVASAIDALAAEERGVSEARRDVITALDTLQDELKRRYKDDPTLSLR